jgi:fumarate hydratase class I
MAKGGGSANKTFLFQETKARRTLRARAPPAQRRLTGRCAACVPQALLNPTRMMSFLEEKIASLGTAACPPYHLALVIGGLSAEQTLKTVKYASARYYDNLPTRCVSSGHAARLAASPASPLQQP